MTRAQYIRARFDCVGECGRTTGFQVRTCKPRNKPYSEPQDRVIDRLVAREWLPLVRVIRGVPGIVAACPDCAPEFEDAPVLEEHEGALKKS